MTILRSSGAALAAVGLAPFVLGAMIVRPRLRHGLRERLGLRSLVDDDPRRPISIHASSVGEIKAATRLVAALEARGERVQLTASTLAGRAVARNDLPTTPSSLAPLDHPWSVAGALRGGLPVLSVLIETELWPSWIAAMARRGVPVVIASGRLSDRSFPRYQRLRAPLSRTLQRLAAVGARTELDAERFVALGVPEDRVCVTGDLKLDPPAGQPALAIDLIRALAEVPVVIGGSTHDGEELALLDAQQAAEKEGHGFVLVLAPRDLARSAEVVELCRRRGRRALRRSDLGGRHLVPGEVLVLDTLGELAALYATASLAFVGGTFSRTGGHNLIEPVHAGCPVLFGPRFENVRKIVEILEPDGAARRVADGEALAREVIAAFEDPEACRIRGALGRDRLEAHRGSVERTVGLLERFLGSSTPRRANPDGSDA